MTDNEAHGQAFEHGKAVGYEQCRRELLPCRIGDTVWGIRKGRGGSRWVAQGRVYRMYYGDDMRLCICVKNVCFGFWGQQVFATRAEAEAALERERCANADD